MTKALDFRILEGWWRSHSHDKSGGNGTGNGAAPTPALVEAPWLKQLDQAGIPRHLTFPTTTLARLLDQTADRFTNAPALVYADKQCTYGELLARVNRMAGGLAGLGVRKGDRVLLTLPNCPEFVVSFFAIQKLGAVAVNVGPLMGADDLEKVIAMTTPKVTIALDLQSPLLMKAAHASTVQHSVWVSLQLYQTVLKRVGYQFKLWHRPSANGEKVTHHSLNDLMATAASRPPTVEPDVSDLAVLQATGGTTGTLKLVQLSHRNLICNAAQMTVWIGSRVGQERHLAVLPMFHVYGLTTALLSSIYNGACVVMATRFHPRETIALIRKHKPTLLLLVPAILHSLSDFLEKDTLPSKLEGARICVSGAAPLPPEVGERFTKLTGVPCIEGYGLTEAGPVTHVNLPINARAGSIGLPLPDTKVRVVDLEVGVRDVIPGEAGELLISGPQVMSGYFANPKETDRVLWTDEKGTKWLRTGDVARYDADGFFYICDRKKDMIIRSGMKVYPAKVETALKKHPAVADVAVVGKPDPVHTELVIAYIVRKDIKDELPRGLADELRLFCRQHLAPYEVPAAFEFIDQIPRSGLGKVLKRDLRKLPEIPKQQSPEAEEKETA